PSAAHAFAPPVRGAGPRAAHVPRDRLGLVRAQSRAAHRLGAGGSTTGTTPAAAADEASGRSARATAGGRRTTTSPPRRPPRARPLTMLRREPPGWRPVPARRAAVALALAAAPGVFFVHAFHYRRYVRDDAYITLRYAWNLSSGRGPYFNPGEHVEGYTNF